MKFWSMTAQDEFDRKFNYTYMMPFFQDIMVPPDIIYKDVFRLLATAILVEMGHAARAVWTCEESEVQLEWDLSPISW